MGTKYRFLFLKNLFERRSELNQIFGSSILEEEVKNHQQVGGEKDRYSFLLLCGRLVLLMRIEDTTPSTGSVAPSPRLAGRLTDSFSSFIFLYSFLTEPLYIDSSWKFGWRRLVVVRRPADNPGRRCSPPRRNDPVSR